MHKPKKSRKLLHAALFAACMVVALFWGNGKETKAASGYVLKVNRKQNVITAYKNNVPVRVMLCSTGKNNATPTGTYYTQAKMRWHELNGPVWGQYCTRISGHYLFHSVYYRSYNDNTTLAINQYRKLGQQASHGCVRVTVEDAKWIYDNCSVGTKVVIYDSNDPGPLGKPSSIKVKIKSSGKWDPTDTDPNNPHYKYRPTITISSDKATKVTVGTVYDLTDGVTAKDYKNKNITSKIKVNGKVDTSTPGTYYLKYWVQDSRNYYTYKEFKVKVVKAKKPVLTGLANKTLKLTDGKKYVSLKYLKGITACDRNGKNLTSKIKITYSSDYGTKIKKITSSNTLRFTKPGTYRIKYSVTGTKANGKKTTTKTISIYVRDYTTPVVTDATVKNEAGQQVVYVGTTYGEEQIFEGITAKTTHRNLTNIKKRVTYTIKKDGQKVAAVDTTVAGTYVITYHVTSVNGVKGNTITRTVVVEEEPQPDNPSDGTTEDTTTETTETTTETTTEAPTTSTIEAAITEA